MLKRRQQLTRRFDTKCTDAQCLNNVSALYSLQHRNMLMLKALRSAASLTEQETMELKNLVEGRS